MDLCKRATNKLATITCRPGSPQKSIYLSQSRTENRFEYMRPDKLHSQTVKEITGKLVRRADSNLSLRSLYLRKEKEGTVNFRNIKLFEHPSSKRVLDNSLQPEVKIRNPSSRKSSCEKSIFFENTNTNKSLLLNTETNLIKSGRKRNSLVYKSFTFDSLSKHLFNDRSNNFQTKPDRPSKKFNNNITSSKDKFLQKPIVTKTYKNKNNCYSGWKNGTWDLKAPIPGTPKKSASNISTANITPLNVNGAVNKYVPLSKKGKMPTVKVNFGFGKTNLTQILNYGIDSSTFKKVIR